MPFFRPAGLVLTCAQLALPREAGAFELSGAWSTEADLCNKVFIKKGDQVTFTELSDLYGSGFVVNGNRIVGKTAICTIESKQQDGDHLGLSASCATSIMYQNLKFSLKILDDNSIVRTIEEVPGMTVKYFRCKI
jgi:hypothetical protein